ncbi:MAG TPA: fasciclin domain-containing protein, partial [Lacibacter sp.]|nr:fasciclin domain-containing protein [Lacibacter sp.]
MKKIISHSLIALLLLSSCNKDITAPEPITPATTSGQSIGELINTDANYTLLKHALTRAGLLATVTSKNTTFTLFAPDNAAFTASGIASTAVIDALPLASLTGLLNYHII